MSGHTTNLLRVIILLVFVSVVRAAGRLQSIIADSMVLRQGVEIRSWGSAKADECVAVSLKDKSASTVADAQGHWQVWLGPLKAGGPLDLAVKGDKVLTVK